MQTAIDAVAGTGGTVLVPAGVYMIDAVAKPRFSLKDNMTLKLADGATLKAIPNDQKKYAILTISSVTQCHGDRGARSKGSVMSTKPRRGSGARELTLGTAPSTSSSQG
jgi:polygalacturonase